MKISEDLRKIILKLPFYQQIKDKIIIFLMDIIILLTVLIIFLFNPSWFLITIIIWISFFYTYPKIEKSISNILNMEKFKRDNKDKGEENLSIIFNNLITTIQNSIEFHELRLNRYLRLKRKTPILIIIKFFLYISITIISFLIIASTLDIPPEYKSIFNFLQRVIQNLIFNPLFWIDTYIYRYKLTYRCYKKSLVYFKTRINLIYHNSKIKREIENFDETEIQIQKLNIRIDEFNNLIKPFYYYIKEFEIIAIIGIFFGTIFNEILFSNLIYITASITFFFIINLSYILIRLRVNSKIKKSNYYKYIISKLDSLTLFLME